MFGKKKAPTPLDRMIKDVEDLIATSDETSDEYATLVDRYEELLTLREHTSRNRTDLRDWIPVIGSIGGVLIIVAFEAFGHTLTSKSVGFVSKLRS